MGKAGFMLPPDPGGIDAVAVPPAPAIPYESEWEAQRIDLAIWAEDCDEETLHADVLA